MEVRVETAGWEARLRGLGFDLQAGEPGAALKQGHEFDVCLGRMLQAAALCRESHSLQNDKELHSH